MHHAQMAEKQEAGFMALINENLELRRVSYHGDNKKEPEMAPGDFLQYKGSRKNLKDEEKKI